MIHYDVSMCQGFANIPGTQMHSFITNGDLAPKRQFQKSHVGALQATIRKHLDALGHGCTSFSEKLRLDTILEVHPLFWNQLCMRLQHIWCVADGLETLMQSKQTHGSVGTCI